MFYNKVIKWDLMIHTAVFDLNEVLNLYEVAYIMKLIISPWSTLYVTTFNIH